MMPQKLHAGYKVLIRDNDDNEEILLTLMQFEHGQHKLFDIEDGNRFFDEVFSSHLDEAGVYLDEMREVIQNHDYTLVDVIRG